MEIQQPAVLLSGAQTITGAKTFAATTTMSGSLVQGSSSSEVITPGPIITTDTTLGGNSNFHISAAAGARIETLPVSANFVNRRIVYVKVDATANTITLVPQPGGTIGGSANYVLNAQFQTVTLVNIDSSVAGAWVVVGKS